MTKPTQLQLPLSIFDTGAEADSAFGFSFAVKRSPRRRTIELLINQGRVTLMLPSFVSNAEGLAFVRQKREWVLSTLAKQQKFLSEVVPKQYQQGEVFQYLGRQYRLNICVAKQSGVELLNGQLLVKIPTRHLDNKRDVVKKALWRWYQRRANDVLAEKTAELAQRWRLQVNKIQLRKTKSEWGHCTSEGVIQYNWLIMMAPEAVVNYLVAHEVSHLRHRNHSKAFWNHVEKLCPSYKPARQWLRDYGHTLTV